jgi:hypothetical protein
MSDWDKENEAFLIKIGQVKAVPAAKPATTKKDEE